MLTERQANILDFIVGEYVSSATPVPSQSVARQRFLKASAATVRNEMAELETEGYIVRRHISAGGIPSDKGYRLHVETMSPAPGLSDDEDRQLRQQFDEVRRDLEAGTRFLSELLSTLVRNVGVATYPKADRSRVRRLELVGLQEAIALLVVVLQEARTRQRLVHLAEAMSQDELTTLSNKLSAIVGGSSRSALMATTVPLTPVERQVLAAANDILTDEESRHHEDPQVSGLRHLLHQPEFESSGKLRDLVELFEGRVYLREELPRVLAGEQFRTVIGEENEAGEMQECSVVVARYGPQDGIGGLIGVIGPTRMEYRRSIASVRLVTSLMNELVAELS